MRVLIGRHSFVSVSWVRNFYRRQSLRFFWKKAGCTVITFPKTLFLIIVLALMPFFVTLVTCYRNYYRVCDRSILDELRMSYPIIEFIKKSGCHTYDSTGFRHLYALFAEPKFPLALITMNLTSHKSTFTQPSRDAIGGSTPIVFASRFIR